jgi:hypothetical protein
VRVPAWRLRRIAVLAGASVSFTIVPGCGGTSLTATGPAAAGKRFVDAVTVGDTRSWCPQIDAGLIGPGRQGQLPGPLLKQCEQDDLFLLMGSCDSEAAVAGASVSSATTNGDRADVVLSNGAHLQLRSAQGRWLVERIVPGRSRHKPSGGRCSSSITVPA